MLVSSVKHIPSGRWAHEGPGNHKAGWYMEITEKTEAILRKLPQHTLSPLSASAPFPAPIYNNVSLCALDSTFHCCCSVAKSCPTICNPMDYSTLGLPVHHQLLEFTQTHVHWVTDAIQPSHPLLSPSPPTFNLSQHQGLFQWVSFFRIRWPKYWSFSFNISPSNEYSELISFKIDWLDLLAVQGTLKNLLQHYSSKTSILQRSAFFTVQLSHPYMTTGKTIALTRQTFVSKVMSLLFNMLSRLVITFLPRVRSTE